MYGEVNDAVGRRGEHMMGAEKLLRTRTTDTYIAIGNEITRNIGCCMEIINRGECMICAVGCTIRVPTVGAY
jgi:hypothetical protein